MDHENILSNRVATEPEGHEQVLCQSCGEEMIFAMQDNHHQFSVGLRTVLYCLKAAEAEGNVPSLPDEWWIQVKGRHGLKELWKYDKRE
ncbi:XRE family transcriptional regulator [Pseudodesulfovibrio tunisiensis]|uniref:XRE family transcriptional regulator n=1 Tax=Pseudodesulfovibrio tunisiensis TaxID=463192 RepID=UPI001FB3863E|nr:XRE family transcriptional regulator [Pseudodesulfovibrio tunisiensis]